VVPIGASSALYTITSDQFEDIGAIGIYTSHAQNPGSWGDLSFTNMSFIATASIPPLQPSRHPYSRGRSSHF